MTKPPALIFSCSHCGAQFNKWTGRCLECGKWGSIEKIPALGGSALGGKVQKEIDTSMKVEMIALSQIDNTQVPRIKTGIGEMDRVVGGGLVPGSIILLGGEPGVGKSTLALQLAVTLTTPVLYFSGEESKEQIKLRAERLHLTNNNLLVANITEVERIIATAHTFPHPLILIDSVQTIASNEVEGEAGNINQIKACTAKLMEYAKTTNAIVVLIGQVTKDGAVAGPKTLEHLVDVVLYLEGDKFHNYRILRAVKNRFGSTDEIGVFTMEEIGLKEVANPSELFLADRAAGVAGTAVTCLIEGSRPLLVEIQALVTKTAFGYPQRRASGFDLNRLQVLIAVLMKRSGLPLDSHDVFLNVVGGLTAEEPAADLAVVLAIASAMKNKQLPAGLAAFGEVGLGGEVRPVAHSKKRLEEIKKLGLTYAVIPFSKETPHITGLKIAPVKNVKELVEKIVE